MALLDRLLGTEEPKIPVHQFMAALAEYKRQAITGQQVINAFGLNGTEATALQEFLNGMDANGIDRALLHDVLLLGAAGLYTKNFVRNRLGLS